MKLRGKLMYSTPSRCLDGLAIYTKMVDKSNQLHVDTYDQASLAARIWADLSVIDLLAPLHPGHMFKPPSGPVESQHKLISHQVGSSPSARASSAQDSSSAAASFFSPLMPVVASYGDLIRESLGEAFRSLAAVRCLVEVILMRICECTRTQE
jgi:hypothetical protein